MRSVIVNKTNLEFRNSRLEVSNTKSNDPTGALRKPCECWPTIGQGRSKDG